MRLSILVLLTFAAGLSAAPPVVTLPKEVPGEVGGFVVVRADVKDAKAVKYVTLDAGLSVFPGDLLTDKTVTVVVASKPGRYRILAYAGNADGASDPATTTVVIGGATDSQPPPKPIDPPPVTGSKLFFLVVRGNGPIDPATEKLLTLPAWADLRKDGHLMKDVPLTELPAGVTVPAGTTLPSLLTFRVAVDGKSMSPAGDPKPLPVSDDKIRELIK